MLGLGNNLAQGGGSLPFQTNRYSILFTASNQEYIIMDRDSSPDTTFSISAWVKKVGSGDWDTIYSTKSQVLLATNGQEAIRFTVSGGANRIQSADGVLSLNTWHHIVATYTRFPDPDEAKLYLDGELLSTTLAGTLDVPNEQIPHIGAKSNGGVGAYFDGYIDEVAWWKAEDPPLGVLSADAVRAMYNQGQPFDLSKDFGNYDFSHKLQFWMRMGDGDTFPIIKDHATLFGEVPQVPNNGTMTVYPSGNMASSDIVTEIPRQVKGFDTDNTYSINLASADSEYINLFDGAGLNFGTADFTISAWVKVADWTNQNIITKKKDGNYSWKLRAQGTDKLQFISEGNSVAGPTITSGNSMTTHEGSWVHVVIVADRDAYTRLYVNGVLDKSGSASATDIDNDGSAYIGRLDNTYLNGNVDEVAIWKTALDNDAVRAIYNGGVGGMNYGGNQGAYDVSSSLSGWWRMGDGTHDDNLVYPGSEGVTDESNVELGTDLISTVPVTTSAPLLWSADTPGDPFSGTLTKDGSGAGIAWSTQLNYLIEDKFYKISYTLTVDLGTFRVIAGNEGGVVRTTSGDYVDYIKCSPSSNEFRLDPYTLNFTGTISNLVVQPLSGNPGRLVNGATIDSSTKP